MEEFRIKFGADSALRDYITDAFRAKGAMAKVLTSTETNKRKTETICVLTTESIFKEVASDALALFYKFKTLDKVFKTKKHGVHYGAFIGILIAQDFDRDIENISGIIPSGNEVNFDGIFTFLLAGMDKEWRTLGALAYRLYAQCKEDEDVVALIKYFLGGEILLGRKLVVDNGIYFDDTNEDMPCARVFENEEENLALNLLLRKPAEIIVPFPYKYTGGLVELIKKLGS